MFWRRTLLQSGIPSAIPEGDVPSVNALCVSDQVIIHQTPLTGCVVFIEHCNGMAEHAAPSMTLSTGSSRLGTPLTT